MYMGRAHSTLMGVEIPQIMSKWAMTGSARESLGGLIRELKNKAVLEYKYYNTDLYLGHNLSFPQISPIIKDNYFTKKSKES
jgi:hypothetical protein